MNRHGFLVLYFCVVNLSQSIFSVFVNFFYGGGGKLFLQIAGKNAKIVKIRTHKTFVPHGISSLSELFLFCSQLVSIFEENNNIKNIIPFVGKKASAHLKFSFIACNAIEL